MKWIVLFGVNLILSFQVVLSYCENDASIPSPPCCHSQCCCSQCPRESCLRPPEDATVLHPCSCDQSLQYSCTQNSNPIYPTLLPPLPMNYPLPPLPYPNNNPQYPRPYPQYPNPRSYPVVIVPGSQSQQIRRPFPKPDYMKPCLCGTVPPTCQQMLPCGIDQNSGNYNSWYTWDAWNLNFLVLETPQGIAVLIIAIVLLLMIICLIIGLIMACIRSRKSSEIRTEWDFERHEKLNNSNSEIAQNESKKDRKNRKN